jgi:site-specific recombinase XerD
MPLLEPHLLITYQQWLNTTPDNQAASTAHLYYRIAINFLNYFASTHARYLNDINAETITLFLHVRKGHRPYSSASVRVREAALERFFLWSYSNGFIRENPMVSYRRGKITPKRLDVAAADTDSPFVSTALPSANLNAPTRLLGLTSHEQKRLRSHAVAAEDMWAIRNRCVVTLLLASGLGIEELVGLTNQDVQLPAGYLEVRNAHQKARRVYVDVDLCRQDYENWLALHPLNTQPAFCVFITRRLTPLSVRLVYHIVSQYLTAAGIRKKKTEWVLTSCDKPPFSMRSKKV